MTNAAARDRSLAAVLERLLAAGTSTRSALIAETGFSKATIARLVLELEELGLAEIREAAPADRPGRKSHGIGVPRALGHTVGLSLGLRSSHAVALDLAGREVGRLHEPTPTFAHAEEAVTWATDFVRGFSASLGGAGPQLGLSLALPGRVRDGVPISALPAPLAPLSGHAFKHALADALGMPILLESDADMALAGVTSRGLVAPEASAVLLTMSTVLTTATRTRGGLIEPRSAALGDVGALPLVISSAPVRAGALLSVTGMRAHASRIGIGLERTEDLWTVESAEVVRLRRDFTEAVTAAILVAAVSTDPEVCVLTGRLALLAARVAPEVRRALSDALDDPPRLIVTGQDDNGMTTATGSAHMALAIEQRRLVDRVRAGEPAG